MHFSVSTLLAVAAAAQLTLAAPEPLLRGKWESRVVDLEDHEDPQALLERLPAVIEKPPTRGGWHGGIHVPPHHEAAGGDVPRRIIFARNPKAMNHDVWASRIRSGHDHEIVKDIHQWRGEKKVAETVGAVLDTAGGRDRPDGILRISRRDPEAMHRFREASWKHDLVAIKRPPPMREPSRDWNSKGGIIAVPTLTWNKPDKEPVREIGKIIRRDPEPFRHFAPAREIMSNHRGEVEMIPPPAGLAWGVNRGHALTKRDPAARKEPGVWSVVDGPEGDTNELVKLRGRKQLRKDAESLLRRFRQGNNGLWAKPILDKRDPEALKAVHEPWLVRDPSRASNGIGGIVAKEPTRAWGGRRHHYGGAEPTVALADGAFHKEVIRD